MAEMKNEERFTVGDLVRTNCQMYFVDMWNHDTGEEDETFFPRGHYLKVCGVSEDGIEVQLTAGFVALLAREDLETVE